MLVCSGLRLSTQFVDVQDVDPDQRVEQATRGSISERGTHLVEEILRSNEASSIAVLNGLEQEPGGESGLPHTSVSNENQVFGLGDKLEFGQRANLLGVDARLPLEGKGFNRPGLGQSRLLDPPREGGLLPMMCCARKRRARKAPYESWCFSACASSSSMMAAIFFRWRLRSSCSISSVMTRTPRRPAAGGNSPSRSRARSGVPADRDQKRPSGLRAGPPGETGRADTRDTARAVDAAPACRGPHSAV